MDISDSGCRITGSTRLTGLLGSPVRHSISPLMHNESFRILGLDYVYLCFEVGEGSLERAVSGLKECGIAGFNLTMPNKTCIIPLLDRLSLSAELIGAVNTVVNENGMLSGYNTDGIGFMQSVRDAGITVPGSVFTLMGGGGAASAISVQAAIDGISELNIFVRPQSRFYGRTQRTAKLISSKTGCRVNVFDNADKAELKSSLQRSSLLINATSVGMSPHEDESIIEDTSLFDSHLTVADVIYHPMRTRLLREAEGAGCKTFNGMYMLLYQGAEAFRLFTGRDMPVDIIRAKYFGRQ
ncbi:MAG: shikimate dehydrogenase [Blautia sp.]|nr:shikimate dehydrogenase [Blautia sp.]